MLVHDFPTSSIEFFDLTHKLADDFDIYLLDFPGYGLSDKPPEPYVYSLYDDARLLVHTITEVWQLTGFRLLTHDRVSSVGMITLGMLAEADPPSLPVDLILTKAPAAFFEFGHVATTLLILRSTQLLTSPERTVTAATSRAILNLRRPQRGGYGGVAGRRTLV